MMVETICGVLSGGPFASNIRNWKGDLRVANLVSSQPVFRCTGILYLNVLYLDVL